MNFNVSIFLTDRAFSEEIVKEIREKGKTDGFTVPSAEEADAIGMTVEDVVLNLMISFGASVTANLATTRLFAMVEDIKRRRKEVAGATMVPAPTEESQQPENSSDAPEEKNDPR